MEILLLRKILASEGVFCELFVKPARLLVCLTFGLSDNEANVCTAQVACSHASSVLG